jgi:hypothetical protein
MVSVLDLSAVDFGAKTWLGQTKNFKEMIFTVSPLST